jgi:hypothetical protein
MKDWQFYLAILILIILVNIKVKEGYEILPEYVYNYNKPSEIIDEMQTIINDEPNPDKIRYVDTKQQSNQLETNRNNENDTYISNNTILKNCNSELDGINNTIITTENETRFLQQQLDNIEIPLLNKCFQFNDILMQYDACQARKAYIEMIL